MKVFNFNLCSPALIYLVFSITQVVVDTIKGLYNVALLKFIMMVLFTLLLNILCERGLGVISWIIVFVPFVLMSVITSILLFVFGLDPSSGIIKPPGHSKKHPVVDTRTAASAPTTSATHAHAKTATSAPTTHAPTAHAKTATSATHAPTPSPVPQTNQKTKTLTQEIVDREQSFANALKQDFNSL